ncbi:hypothetical protein FCM35_KLT16437 [Carex littledalei]|uniref:Disease resistance N-terminal domain-containing protein n=1 Tax=Carex littledalei TaxID=544730 RepID=A0A833VHP8_9POAL|nr:hypothetical protein FCM35_KLT16437 [Carex littledalei]
MAIWAGSAISKFSEWVGSAVVNKLVSMGYSYLRECILPYNSEAKLKRLKTALPQITAVMGVAEALKVKDPNTSEWVEQFRQAVEASQLVLNELEYKNQDEAGESVSSSKKRKRCTINNGTLKRLKDAVTMLDRATTEIDRLLRLATALGVHDLSESRQDTNKIVRRGINLCLAERKVFGSMNVFVNMTHLNLSYLEIDHLSLSPMVSLRNLRFLTIQSCSGFKVLLEIDNLTEIRFKENNSTLTRLSIHDASFRKSFPASIARLMHLHYLSISTDDLVMNLHNVSNSTADLLKELTELPVSKGHGMQNRPSRKLVEPALNRSSLSCSQCYVGFLKVTSSNVAELKNRERYEVGESSHSNKFSAMNVD